MPHELTDRDRERFDRLRDTLTDVEPAAEPSQPPVERSPFDPMLATTFRGELDELSDTTWIAERKFDGTRIALQKFDGKTSLYTRRHIDRSETLSELATHSDEHLPDGIILDGEYCYLTPDGVSRFVPIHQSTGPVDREDLTARYFVFDLLAIDSAWCLREPYLERKGKLFSLLAGDEWIRPVSHVSGNFAAYYDQQIGSGEEGIILKRRTSHYHPGVRSDHWQKVKAFTEANVLAVGFTDGEGRRDDTFGALVLTDGKQYLGRVGSGFDQDTLSRLAEIMIPVEERPISSSRVGRSYTPIEPFVVRVKFQEINAHGKLRAPVYLGRRADLPHDAVEPLTPK